MFRCFFAFALCATPALADGSWPRDRMTLLAGDGPCFAIVAIENRVGIYRKVETLDTEHGPVSIEYYTVGGHNATDHDLVDVVSLPEGVVANPSHIDLPDGDTGVICLMEWSGS